jgi:hypothetical protein
MVSGRGKVAFASGGPICLFISSITSDTVNWNSWNNEQSVENSCAHYQVVFTHQLSCVVQRSAFLAVCMAVRRVRKFVLSTYTRIPYNRPTDTLYIDGRSWYESQAWTFRDTNGAIYLFCKRAAQFLKNDSASRSSLQISNLLRCLKILSLSLSLSHTHTHTHIYRFGNSIYWTLPLLTTIIHFTALQHINQRLVFSVWYHFWLLT